jgi:HEPN domain-containing protein
VAKKRAKRRACSGRTGFTARVEEFPVFEGKIALQDRGSTGIWYNKAMRRMSLKWLKQAEADLQAAWDSYRARHYEWSCFQAQQSGEKALKGIQMASGELVPSEFYEEDTRKCLSSAESILQTVKDLLGK